LLVSSQEFNLFNSTWSIFLPVSGSVSESVPGSVLGSVLGSFERMDVKAVYRFVASAPFLKIKTLF